MKQGQLCFLLQLSRKFIPVFPAPGVGRPEARDPPADTLLLSHHDKSSLRDSCQNPKTQQHDFSLGQAGPAAPAWTPARHLATLCPPARPALWQKGPGMWNRPQALPGPPPMIPAPALLFQVQRGTSSCPSTGQPQAQRSELQELGLQKRRRQGLCLSAVREPPRARSLHSTWYLRRPQTPAFSSR